MVQAGILTGESLVGAGLLSGIVDFAVERVIAGWARSPNASELAVEASIDGARVAAACVRDEQDPQLIKYRIALPRPVLASELARKQVTVEAQTTTERLTLELWRPILLAAELDDMDATMIERVLRSLSPEKHNEMARLLAAQMPIAPKTSGTSDTSIYDDLMRWS